jgi:DNA-binding CsgD family transcriptional regulator
LHIIPTCGTRYFRFDVVAKAWQEVYAEDLTAAQILPRSNIDLTPRELEVFTLIGQGHSNSEIETTLVVAETTVKTQVARSAASSASATAPGVSEGVERIWKGAIASGGA